MIEGHGDDIYRYDDLVKMNFSSNVYQHVNLTGLKEHLMGNFDLVGNYPEPQPRSLEKLIAFKEGISPEAVMVTNGATEAIYLIAQLYRGSASIIPQPTFSEYADACRTHNHIISYENTDELTQLPRDRVYWICNPNNPSGNVLMKGFMDYLVRRSPRYTFVVDQSYECYTKEPLLVAREMNGVANLLLLHSFSKTYGVPGLRLGYVTGDPSLIQLLRNLRHPWSVSSMAIEAGKYLLKHGQPAIQDLDSYLEETQRLRSELRQTAGVRVFETKTNYMLCELDNASAIDLKSNLIHQHGILIRDCSNFYGLSKHFFRVSAQKPEENDALVAAIREFLNAKP
ncbi:MAG: pyridoxal phosphate-dependent class II aminotransferase [Prevotella sp.]|nr:pyridoxal phosphate-dependent class II aminotransferase [Prevotella sp.]